MDDSISTPVLDLLTAAKGRAWLHMPGHGGVLPWLDAGLDLTELPVTDDLGEPFFGGAFEAAQALMADAAGAAGCVFLTGGSTLGVQAMLLACAPLGGKVILERNAHKSAIAACAIGGLTPVYVAPRWDDALGRAFLDPADVIEAIRAHPDAAAVLVTRPDYYGSCPDINGIANACRAFGMTLLIDEAHGAHFMFGGEVPSAGALGADVWTSGAHKTLPALTQSACIFFHDRRNEAALRRVVHILGSSSPSFLLAASIDWARARMTQSGAVWMERTVNENRALRARLAREGFGDCHADWAQRGILCDETRLVMDTSVRGISGLDAQNALADSGIDIEMADERRIVCIPPLSDARDALIRLENALLALPRGKPLAPIAPITAGMPQLVCGVREAAFAKSIALPIEQAEGRVCAEAFGVYPPGIPLAMPGERIDREIVRAIVGARRAGYRFFGLNGGCAGVMEV